MSKMRVKFGLIFDIFTLANNVSAAVYRDTRGFFNSHTKKILCVKT